MFLVSLLQGKLWTWDTGLHNDFWYRHATERLLKTIFLQLYCSVFCKSVYYCNVISKKSFFAMIWTEVWISCNNNPTKKLFLKWFLHLGCSCPGGSKVKCWTVNLKVWVPAQQWSLLLLYQEWQREFTGLFPLRKACGPVAQWVRFGKINRRKLLSRLWVQVPLKQIEKYWMHSFYSYCID